MAKLRQFVKSQPTNPVSPALLALNNAHAAELSELSAATVIGSKTVRYLTRRL